MEYKAKAMNISSNKNHSGFEKKIIEESSDYINAVTLLWWGTQQNLVLRLWFSMCGDW